MCVLFKKMASEEPKRAEAKEAEAEAEAGGQDQPKVRIFFLWFIFFICLKRCHISKHNP